MSTRSDSRAVTHEPTERLSVSGEPQGRKQRFDKVVQPMEARLRAIVSAPGR
jgi:hypothetical protein